MVQSISLNTSIAFTCTGYVAGISCAAMKIANTTSVSAKLVVFSPLCGAIAGLAHIIFSTIKEDTRHSQSHPRLVNVFKPICSLAVGAGISYLLTEGVFAIGLMSEAAIDGILNKAAIEAFFASAAEASAPLGVTPITLVIIAVTVVSLQVLMLKARISRTS